MIRNAYNYFIYNKYINLYIYITINIIHNYNIYYKTIYVKYTTYLIGSLNPINCIYWDYRMF